MTGYFYVTDFLVPAGTAIAAPKVQSVLLDDRVLDAVRIVVPDGHAGLTGVSVRSQGVNIAPYVQGTWLVANNEIVDIPYDDLIAADYLQLWGYNTDVFDHTFHLRWTLTDIAAAALPVDVSSPQSTAPGADTVQAVAALSGSLLAAIPPQLTAPPGTGGHTGPPPRR